MPERVMVAFVPPDQAKEQIVQEGENATAFDDLHMTLVYLGDMEDTSSLHQVVRDFTSQHAPIPANITGFGVFTDAEEGQWVLYAGVDSPNIQPTKQHLVEELRAVDIESPSEHGFTPHITLDRLLPGTAVSPEIPLIPVVFDAMEIWEDGERTNYAMTGEILMRQTDFPKSGDDMKVSLRNSQYPQFDRAYAENLRGEHPDIWDAGGNIRGNEAFTLWGRARDGSEGDAVLEWIQEREAWMARHFEDGRQFSDNSLSPNLSNVAGIIAQIKWGGIGTLGESRMKEVIGELIDKQDRSNHEEEEKRMDKKKRKGLIEWFGNLLDGVFGELPKTRVIKEVSSWDGSPSRWESTEAYCDACLIDVNDAAGRDEKVQSHCKLPVRGPDDASNVFVDRAVFAAAGGNGIQAVTKPDDVPRDAWDDAVRDAAEVLVVAYDQMDMDAPEAVVEMTERTTERAMSIELAWEQVWEAIMEMDGPMMYPVDLFLDNDQMFVIASQDGRLYRLPIAQVGTEIMVGEPVLVEAMFAQASRSRTIMRNAETGRARIAQVVATAVLNRVGEIDSRKLFDTFIERANQESLWPLIDFNHINEIVVGRVVSGGLFRDENCYIAVWEFDNTEIGRQAEKGYLADPDMWGASIEFEVYDYGLEEIADGVRVPVYRDGRNTFITICEEGSAASHYTRTKFAKRSIDMDENTRANLAALLDGDEDMVEQVANMVDTANRTIRETNQVTRQQGAEQIEEDEVEVEVVVDLGDEDTLSAVVEDIVNHPKFQEAIGNVQQTVDLSVIEGALEKINGRLDSMEQTQADTKRQWEDSLPSATTRVTVRPSGSHRPSRVRETHQVEDAGGSYADKAASTLASKGLK